MRKGGWCPMSAPLGFPLGSLWPSEACRSCFGLCTLHLDCPPAHLPRSSSCSALGPCICSPTLVCLRRAAVSVLAAIWCGPISDHSFFSVSPCIQVSHSRWRPGTVCVASSWKILISPAKLCAQEESQSLACMQGAVVPGCIRGRWAPWESDRAAQSLIHLARWGWLSDWLLNG